MIDGPISTPADILCSMFVQEPYPFAWCETHDEVFPLGGICPFYVEK